ncbi:MAG: hypothetical protein EOM64_00300 [Erysipelotrichia bacterium]|nr:hypothetical protein [Erysipelotrichia bacterium]
MPKHEFSTREKALLLICAALALGIFYYLFAYQNFQEMERRYDTVDLEEQIMIEEAKLSSLKSMQEEIDAAAGQNSGEIAVYNNQSNEIQALNDILQDRASDVSISWTQPTLTGSIVRRNAAISLKTGSYTTGRAILNDLSACKYRLIINDIQMDSGGGDAVLSTSTSVSVSVSVTFFETIEGASAVTGLTVLEEAAATPAAE